MLREHTRPLQQVHTSFFLRFCCLHFWREDFESIETISKPPVQQKSSQNKQESHGLSCQGEDRQLLSRAAGHHGQVRRHANDGHDKRRGSRHFERLPQGVAQTISSCVKEPKSQSLLSSRDQPPSHPYTDVHSISTHTADRATSGGYRL